MVGDVLLASKIPRSELYFTTKLPPKIRGYDGTKAAIKESLSNCGLEYIDLYLIHAPYGNRESRLGQWKAVEESVLAGEIKSAGVSNYGVHHLEELWNSNPQVKPVVNQIELHPFLTRNDIVAWCQEHDIVLEAYSPLTRGQKLDDPDIQNIARKYRKTAAQLLIRWSLQRVKSRLSLLNWSKRQGICESAKKHHGLQDQREC